MKLVARNRRNETWTMDSESQHYTAKHRDSRGRFTPQTDHFDSSSNAKLLWLMESANVSSVDVQDEDL